MTLTPLDLLPLETKKGPSRDLGGLVRLTARITRFSTAIYTGWFVDLTGLAIPESLHWNSTPARHNPVALIIHSYLPHCLTITISLFDSGRPIAPWS